MPLLGIIGLACGLVFIPFFGAYFWFRRSALRGSDACSREKVQAVKTIKRPGPRLCPFTLREGTKPLLFCTQRVGHTGAHTFAKWEASR